MDKLFCVGTVSMFLAVASYVVFLLYLGYKQEMNSRKRKNVLNELVIALEETQIRIALIGHPDEPFDWAYEIKLIESALALAEEKK